MFSLAQYTSFASLDSACNSKDSIRLKKGKVPQHGTQRGEETCQKKRRNVRLVQR